MGIPWVNGQEIAHTLGLTPPHRNPKSQQLICYSDESDMCSGAIAVNSVCRRLSKGRSGAPIEHELGSQNINGGRSYPSAKNALKRVEMK